ncbi:hypothetical protein C2845_PM04G24580 [Panicum miliaceum]|uniref:Uncharacterized protein n=1 Tax=Panicum miliaceum TaxID=4540 RepID=A0A3L6QPQ3_PANMI|nr:hypothetical protein C2845_PM04G24580 [Panicum miliaceum]
MALPVILLSIYPTLQLPAIPPPSAPIYHLSLLPATISSPAAGQAPLLLAGGGQASLLATAGAARAAHPSARQSDADPASAGARPPTLPPRLVTRVPLSPPLHIHAAPRIPTSLRRPSTPMPARHVRPVVTAPPRPCGTARPGRPSLPLPAHAGAARAACRRRLSPPMPARRVRPAVAAPPETGRRRPGRRCGRFGVHHEGEMPAGGERRRRHGGASADRPKEEGRKRERKERLN